MPPLDRLLAALSLEMEGKKTDASDAYKLLTSISAGTDKWDPERNLPRTVILHSSDPIELTWFDLINQCANQRPITEWAKGGDCLPESPRERIQKIFDMYQERVALDIFYRVNVFYGGLACPHVFSEDPRTGQWKFQSCDPCELEIQVFGGGGHEAPEGIQRKIADSRAGAGNRVH